MRTGGDASETAWNKDWFIICNCGGCCHHPSRFLSKLWKIWFVFFFFFLFVCDKISVKLINLHRQARQMMTTHFINHRICVKSNGRCVSKCLWLKTLLCVIRNLSHRWAHPSTNIHLTLFSFQMRFFLELK